MNLSCIQAIWEEQRLVYGITLRVTQAFPKDKMDVRPIPNMRTPKELIAHMAATMRMVGEGIPKGKIDDYSEVEKEAVAKPYDAFMKWAGDSFKVADASIRSLTEAQATSMVKNPWTTDFPAFVCVQIIFDEHLHHRGQLYAYLRALNVEPPFMWDFENNAPEYQPRQHQPA